MFGLNRDTKQRIIAQAGKLYRTPKGNVYLAIPLYDKKGKLHGHVIYVKNNLIEGQKPMYIGYSPIPKIRRCDEWQWDY